MLSRRSFFGFAALAPLAPVAAKAAEPMQIHAKVARLKPYLSGEAAGESLTQAGFRPSFGLGGVAPEAGAASLRLPSMADGGFIKAPDIAEMKPHLDVLDAERESARRIADQCRGWSYQPIYGADSAADAAGATEWL